MKQHSKFNDRYGWLRGFSVVPSWGARIEEAWWSYNGKRMREEVALARTVHANCIRLWIEFSAWQAEPRNPSSLRRGSGPDAGLSANKRQLAKTRTRA